MIPLNFSPDYRSRRSNILATRGMVATSHPLAAQVGLDILKMGGNAADAAVAVAAMLDVVKPISTGIGRDMFALYWDAKTRKVTALNGSSRAPARSYAFPPWRRPYAASRSRVRITSTAGISRAGSASTCSVTADGSRPRTWPCTKVRGKRPSPQTIAG
ncbi:MAG TPA: hypothetical protein G4O05_03015 [Caldilineae bacterium]|nr:hypothetical protein [Caldilineae bacterium]